MMKRNVLIILSLILLVGAVFRFFKLGEVPDGFHRDEAFLGYNAYSILKTGRDITGAFLPLNLPSFLYSPAGYSYATIPFILFLGLNEISVRFASAFFGWLTILAVCAATFLLFSAQKKLSLNRIHVGLLTAGVLAILPWHINLSRTATENTPVTFLVTVAFCSYLLGYRNGKMRYFILSFILFALSLVCYQAPRAFLPLFVPVLFFLMPPKAPKAKILIGILYASCILMPVGMVLLSPHLSLRIRTVSITASPEMQLIINERNREAGSVDVPPVVSRLFHNKILGYGSQFLTNYFDHFTYSFLFTDQGKPTRYRVPSQGLLYVWMLPFLLIGCYYVFHNDKKIFALLATWYLTTFVGSAMAFDDIPNLQRTEFAVVPISMFTGIGIYVVARWLLVIRRPWVSRIVIVGFLIGVSYAVSGYWFRYFYIQNQHVPIYRQEGYRDLVAKIGSLENNYERIIITNHESAPAIFFLFYRMFDPALFLTQTKGKMITDYDRADFSKYSFAQNDCPISYDLKKGVVVDYPLYNPGEKTLFVDYATCSAEIPDTESIGIIKRLDGTIVFRLFALKPIQGN